MAARHKVAFNDVEVGSLKAVYLLAVNALAFTHKINKATMLALADAVFDSYGRFDWPSLPLQPDQMEDIAVSSIDLLLASGFEIALLDR